MQQRTHKQLRARYIVLALSLAQASCACAGYKWPWQDHPSGESTCQGTPYSGDAAEGDDAGDAETQDATARDTRDAASSSCITEVEVDDAGVVTSVQCRDGG